MEKKLNNLLSLTDFRTGWRANQASKTKRTETGLDILKEGIEEIISEGPEGLENIYDTDEKIQEIISALEELNEDVIDEIVNYLRDVLLEMEQQGFVDEDTTDTIDDEANGDWIAWIEEVITLNNFSEDALNGILDIIDNGSELDSEDAEDVECPDCDGSGQDDEGEDCERCDGTGRVDRPNDIPPDDNYQDFEDDELDELDELEEK